jgi:uncharacterized protein (UPF0335 family)
MKERRKIGPIGDLSDVSASISTPQARQLLEQLQRNEAGAIDIPADVRQLFKRVETR